MVRGLKTIWLAMLVGCGAQSAVAFSLLGPSPATGQTNPALAWQAVTGPEVGIGGSFGGDIGGPLNLGEEFRWNIPVLTYAYDESFLNYFGSGGVAAVEDAIRILNAVGPVSGFTNSAGGFSLDRFPLDTTRQNFRAQALNLIDVKSAVLSLLLEELGLADPVRYTWQIREFRSNVVPNAIPQVDAWWTINRNFDPFTLNPSVHVNNVLYSFRIVDSATPNLDEAVEIKVNPASPNNFPVASAFGFAGVGSFFTGLTRDDVGGLHYLYRTNNFNVETLPTGTDTLEVDFLSPEIIRTVDLINYLEDTTNTTNTQADVLALYPIANITEVRSNVFLEFTTNVTVHFERFPFDPTPIKTIDITSQSVTRFDYTIDNTKFYTNNASSLIISNRISVTAGNPILPPRNGILTNVLSTTNTIFVMTNTVCVTNMVLTNLHTLSTNDDVFVAVPDCTNTFDLMVFSTNSLGAFLNLSLTDTTNVFETQIYFVPNNVHDYIVTNNLGIVRTNETNILTIDRTNVVSSVLQDFFPFTNTAGGQIALQTLDLAILTTNTFGTTNDPAQMAALVPNLLITSTNIRLGLIEQVTLNNNVISTNLFVTNVYDYTFGNILTNEFIGRQWITNRLVEIVPNPIGHITGQTNITNILLERIVTSGGSASSVAIADLNPLGAQNDLLFNGRFLGAEFNGTEIRFIDDGSLTGNVAEARYTNSANLLAINIDSEMTDAAAVVAALSDPVTVGGSVGTIASGFLSFGLPNSDLMFTADAAGAAGNGLTVEFRTPFQIFAGPGPGELSFGINFGAPPEVVSAARPVYATYDSAGNRLRVHVSAGVTTAADVSAYLATVTTNNIPAFNALYTAGFDTSSNPANNGSDVITLPAPQGLADRVTAGGFDGAKAGVSVELFGVNNNLTFEAIAGGAPGNDLRIVFTDLDRITGNLAWPEYDSVANVLTIEIFSGVTDANAVKTAVDTLTGPGMIVFRADYTVTLSVNTSNELTNDGSGPITFVPFTAALDTVNSMDIVFGGDNNDLRVRTVEGGNASGMLTVQFFTQTGLGNIALPTYFSEEQILQIAIEIGVTTATSVELAVAGTGQSGMSEFRALYTFGLNDATEPGNDGSGILNSPIEVTAAMVDISANTGIGKLGANVNISVLEELAGGDFLAVDVSTNLLGFDIVNTVLTNTTNHIELVLTNSTFLHTNTQQIISLTNIDLCEFRRLVETNNPTQLQAIFPDLVITRTNVTPGLMISNTISGAATLLTPYQPALTIPSNVLITNSSTNVFPFFEMEFGNVITNFTHPFQTVILLETNVVQNPYSPAGVTNQLTNVTSRTMTIPGPCGSVLIIPTNTNPRIFGYQILSTNLVTVTSITNTIFSVPISNAFGGVFSNTLSQVTFSTNYFFNAYPIEFRDPRTVGTNGFGLRRETIRPITTHILAAYPIVINSNAPGLETPIISERIEIVRRAQESLLEVIPVNLVAGGGTNATAIRPGINQISFTNVSFNSLIGPTFEPITNFFTTTIVTNGNNLVTTMRRITTRPDILFDARDLGIVGPFEGFPLLSLRSDTSNWQLNDSLNGATQLGGPGVIEGPITITLTTLLPTLLNSSPFTFDEAQSLSQASWGYFDGSSTNVPVAFPDGTLIEDIENKVLQ